MYHVCDSMCTCVWMCIPYTHVYHVCMWSCMDKFANGIWWLIIRPHGSSTMPTEASASASSWRNKVESPHRELSNEARLRTWRILRPGRKQPYWTYVYTNIYVYVYIYIYMNVYVSMHVYMYMYMCIRIRICTCLCTCICIYAYVYYV